jgi:hypothetical protein
MELKFFIAKNINTKIKDSHRKIDMDFSFQHFPLANFSIWMWKLLLKYIDKIWCETCFPSRKVIEKNSWTSFWDLKKLFSHRKCDSSKSSLHVVRKLISNLKQKIDVFFTQYLLLLNHAYPRLYILVIMTNTLSPLLWLLVD